MQRLVRAAHGMSVVSRHNSSQCAHVMRMTVVTCFIPVTCYNEAQVGLHPSLHSAFMAMGLLHKGRMTWILRLALGPIWTFWGFLLHARTVYAVLHHLGSAPPITHVRHFAHAARRIHSDSVAWFLRLSCCCIATGIAHYVGHEGREVLLDVGEVDLSAGVSVGSTLLLGVVGSQTVWRLTPPHLRRNLSAACIIHSIRAVVGGCTLAVWYLPCSPDGRGGQAGSGGWCDAFLHASQPRPHSLGMSLADMLLARGAVCLVSVSAQLTDRFWRLSRAVTLQAGCTLQFSLGHRITPQLMVAPGSSLEYQACYPTLFSVKRLCFNHDDMLRPAAISRPLCSVTQLPHPGHSVYLSDCGGLH